MDLAVIVHMVVVHLHPGICELGHWLVSFIDKDQSKCFSAIVTTELLHTQHTIESILKTSRIKRQPLQVPKSAFPICNAPVFRYHLF